MDPTACLREILALSAKLSAGNLIPSERRYLREGLEAATENLLEWLQCDGFPPEVQEVSPDHVEGCFSTSTKHFAV